MKRVLTAVAATAIAAVITSTGTANASTLRITSGQHACTQTDPEYVIADQGETVTVPQYSYRYTSVAASARYESTYLVTGYTRGSNTTRLCGIAGRDSFQLPAKISAVTVTGGMTYRATGSTTRPGWDLWLSPAGAEYADTTAAAMEHNRRTVEILVQPGGARLYQPGGGGHYRAYIGTRLSSVSLSAVARMVLAHFKLSAGAYYWAAIDGGSETTSGTFRMESYRLDVTTQATATASATRPATHTARGDGRSVTVRALGHATVRRTVTVQVKPGYAPAATARKAAQAAADALALRYARHNATVIADNRLEAEIHHGQVQVPRVTGLRAVTAVAAIRAAGLTAGHVTYVKGRELTVTGTTPAAGDWVKRGSTVSLRVKL